MGNEDILLTGITKIFRTGFGKKKTAVDNLSLAVPRGEVVGLLGPNGSGKSTTLKMILGFLRPTAGEIQVCGQSSTERESRRQIGYLPENPRFQKFLTGYDLLDYYASLFGMGPAERKKRAEYLLELVGISHAGHERVQGYSKGMTQRLAVAQALLNKPRLLIFDEPMSGLDPLGRMEIRKLIARVHDEMPESTIFFSSHVLEDVEQLCSLVALLRKGRLKTYSAMDKLLNQEQQKFDITVGPVSNAIREKLFKGDPGRKTALGICFTVEGTESLKNDLEELTQNHIPIFNITTHRRKLEEALFLDDEEEKTTTGVSL